MLVALTPGLAVLAWALPVQAHDAAHEQRLPTIGAAPDFALTSQDGARVTLRNLRGKVVAVTFIYTSCRDVCPLLTEKMVEVQDELGADFGPEIAFVSITVDPENDTPEALRAYAEAHGADLAGWSFLTGAPASVRDVAHRYGAAVVEASGGQVDHTLLTTLVDGHGAMRVQYLGYRFDPEEFRRDVLSLVNEP